MTNDREFMLFHGYGNDKPIKLLLQKGGYHNSNLKNNQCVSAHCNGNIHLVYITDKGLVSNGYCWNDASSHVFHNALRLESSTGRWFELSNGKIQPYFDEQNYLEQIRKLIQNPKQNIKKINKILEKKKTKTKKIKGIYNGVKK